MESCSTIERRLTVAKCVLDYFAGKGEEESQRYIDLCMSADKLK